MSRAQEDDGVTRPRARPGAAELHAATPASRDRYVDLLRAVAILMVVVGHWLASAVTVTDGRLSGVNAIYVVPWAAQVTWVFQVMPLFFLVGGYANAASYDKHARSGGTAAGWVQARALRLLRPTAVLVVALLAGYAVALAAGADAEVTRTAVWLAGLGLWFLVVYLAIVALAPAVVTWQRRHGVRVVVLLVALVGVGDLARLATGSATPGAASYVLGWLAVHQLGVAWRDGLLTRSRTTAWLLAVGGAAVALALVALGPYGVAMVGAVPPPELTNAAPPTLALLALAVMQTGIALLLRPALAPWLQRPGPWRAVVGVNLVILTIFLWHMVPVVIAGAALVTTGVFPQPEVGSGAWFATRPLWLLILTVLLLALVAVFSRFETGTSAGHAGRPSGLVVGVGILTCVGALAAIGVTGPDGLLPPVWGVPLGELAVLALGLALLRWGGEGGRGSRQRDR